MKPPVYDMIHRAESGWWYRGRSAAVRAIFQRAGVVARGKALDYGAGYGAMRDFFFSYVSVDAIEVYPDARRACSMRGYERVFSNDDEVHAQSGKYGCIGAFDVIEHIDNDSQFLAQISLLLEPGGVLVATVPAHQFLYGPYDEAARHFRRYEKSELHHKLRAAGFEVIQISYWNMSLFPVAALLRLFGTKTGGSLSPSAITDKILGWIVATEAFALRFVPLPIGLSIVFVAQRQ